MRTITAVAELRRAVAAERARGRTIGLVATMGALHDGHLSLVRRARDDGGAVVMSLFVNPAQFDSGEDLAAYPRDAERDTRLAARAGVEILFAPPVNEVYPDGFATTVTVAGLTDGLCGEHRGPGHFAGVATVVAKLLNMVAPDVAYFGQKDAQQVAVIRRLVRDLDMPVRIEACPTVREADGLAMSSRNARLGPGDRARAVGLSRALRAAEDAVAAGERDPRELARVARRTLAEHEIEPEYVELVSPHTFAPVDGVDGPVLLAVAAQVGPARLIDNTIVTPDPRSPSRMHRTMLKAKIHRATVTGCDLNYIGSITIDPDLLEAAEILEYEQVAVVDVDNGARFETYTISGERGSREIKINGAAARLVHRGDLVIVIAYAQYDQDELADYRPRIVHVNAANEVLAVDDRASVLVTG